MNPIFHVDAFTHVPFAGNPAAVCVLPAWKEDSWLQQVAGEMNLSETAFLVKSAEGFDLRWFTPLVEVDLCGHATLASAHVLWSEGLAESDRIAFATRSGTLYAHRRAELIELDFPIKPERPAEAPAGLVEALGVAPLYVGKNQFDYLVEVESEDVLRGMSPDFARLAGLPVRGTIVTSQSKDYDFVSRFFAPAVGVNEDPVTGSAHCCLADYWRKKMERSSFTAFQASARGGVLKVRIEGNRVFLGGRAVIVTMGSLLVG